MNWDALGAIGEIIGAIAVVATLAYLAIQIRNGTRVARSATRHAIAETSIAMGSSLVSDGELAKIFTRDLQGETLAPAEHVRLLAHWYVYMRLNEDIHYQYLAGLLEEDEWDGFRRNLKAILQMPSMKTYWENERTFYSRAFQDEVGSILAEGGDDAGQLQHAYVLRPDDQDASAGDERAPRPPGG